MMTSVFFDKLRHISRDSLHQGLATQARSIDFRCNAGPLVLDLTRELLNDTLFALCMKQAKETGFQHHRDQLFSGGIVNTTENRAALHWLLRAQTATAHLSESLTQVQSTLQDMQFFCTKVIEGDYRPSGSEIQHIVNLGVGGSDLGPRLAYHALKPYQNKCDVHFVANIDGNDLYDTLANLSPERTLFVVASKTFSTLETLENAKAAFAWLQKAGINNPGAHFAAATSRPDRASEFGIASERIFPMWDWVGGRYSLLSSVGLALMIGIGPDAFQQIHAGAHMVDDHFRNAPLETNGPFLMACAGLARINGAEILNHAVIAYDSRLVHFPDYLQQLEMESNGKSTNLDGNPVTYQTCPIIWGGVGTNTQHSFHQLLHQGTIKSGVDFLMPLSQNHGLRTHQAYLQANCLAQAEALFHGKGLDQVTKELRTQGLSEDIIASLAPHKIIQGNKPSTIIGYHTLTPEVLGALIALYEHKVFVQAHFWNINPFDQWGVELGKELCTPVFEALSNPTKNCKDSHTQRWVKYIRALE